MSSISPTKTYDAERFNFTRDVVDAWGQTDNDPVAMLWKPSQSDDTDELCALRYSHFSNRAHKVARGLKSLGFVKGDVLLLVSCKRPEWYEILCGCMLSGIVVCPCSAALTPAELHWRAQRTRASALAGGTRTIQEFLAVDDAASMSSVRCSIELSPSKDISDSRVKAYESLLDVSEHQIQIDWQTHPTDPCLLYFTSGTTGQPKIVKHTHISYPFAHTLTGSCWLDLRPGSILWNVSDQGWAKAVWALFGAWSQGATLFLDADSSSFDPERTIRLLHHYPITTFCAAPAIYRQMVSEESKRYFAATPPQALEHCTSAGENLESRVILEWYEMTDGLVISNGFGQTETTILCGNYPAIPPKVGSMGQPVPGVPLYILNDRREVARPFEEGDIAVLLSDGFHGIFEGYDDEDESTVRPVVSDPRGQSWYLTGDRAYCDEDGYLWYKGRADDVIISAGHRIGPAEVELVLQSHPAIAECAVVGVPNEERGETVKAFVVLRENSLAVPEAQMKQDIREHCLKHKAPQYCPQAIEFVSSAFFPRTVSGKLIRRQLREM